MRINSVTNNIYGRYGVGPVATIVEKTTVEPKHKKYLDRKPLVPYKEGEGVVKWGDIEVTEPENKEAPKGTETQEDKNEEE